MNRWKIVLAAMALAGLCLAAVASAHRKSFSTTLVARYDTGTTTFSGEVNSVKKRCNARRKIVITSSDGFVLGSGRSTSEGTFEFAATTLPYGTVEAEAKRTRIKPKTSAHKHICLPGTTPVVIH
jgi:hypothetical protein